MTNVNGRIARIEARLPPPPAEPDVDLADLPDGELSADEHDLQFYYKFLAFVAENKRSPPDPSQRYLDDEVREAHLRVIHDALMEIENWSPQRREAAEKSLRGKCRMPPRPAQGNLR